MPHAHNDTGCTICDTGFLPDSFYQGLEQTIADHGQALIGVMDHPRYQYTIGNAQHGLPELLCISNSNPEAVGSVLNILGKIQRAAGKGLDEGPVDIGGRIPPRIRHITDLINVRTNYTIQAGQHLGDEGYTVLQVLLPDKHGRYPGDLLIENQWDIPLV